MKKLSNVKTQIFDLFENDTRTKSYLEKRTDIEDAEFIKAALKCRPTNKKLIAIAEDHSQKPEVPDFEIIDLDPKDEILEIFKTDNSTYKRLQRNKDMTLEDFIDLAFKCRPTNGKLKSFVASLKPKEEVLNTKPKDKKVDKPKDKAEVKMVGAEETKPQEEPDLKGFEVITKVIGGKKTNSLKGGTVEYEDDEFNEDDFRFEREKDDEENLAELNEQKEKTKTSPLQKINIPKELLQIFASDSKTLDRIKRTIALSETDDNSLLEVAIKARPTNAKLKDLIKRYSEEQEAIDQMEEDIEVQENLKEIEETKEYSNDPIPFIQNDNSSVTLYVDGEMKVINSEHPNFSRIIAKLAEKDWKEVHPLIDVKTAVKSLIGETIKFEKGGLFYKGEALHGALVERIIDIAKAGIRDITPFLRFLIKLRKNPSERARNELYGFLSSGKIPINEKGNILTYKRINSNYTDCHSGTVDNSIGNTVFMHRGDVNDNSNITCSHGLHVCSYSYLGSFSGDRTVVCEVNPRDVVSIPTDYKNAKMRCCKYTVVKEIKNNGEDVLALSPIYFND